MTRTPDFGSLKLLAAIVLAVAVVVGAGMVIGQAPAMFGVDEEPQASITFDEQTTNGTVVEVDSVSLSDGGFVVITNSAGETLAVSGYLDAGAHENVTIEADEEVELLGRLTATAHEDTTGDESYAFDETDGDEDRPYVADGYPVSDTASVTLAEGATDGELAGDSFLVDNVSGPTNASTNDSVEFSADVSNPTTVDTRQGVEIRVDGRVFERQLLDLEAGETASVTFTLETRGIEPGERTIGIYTPEDGGQTDIAVEYPIEPHLEVDDANDTAVTANATLPFDGFLTVENESDSVRGTSQNLSAGEHDSVPIEYDIAGADENETVAVVMYAGSSVGYDETDGFPDAERITIDGEPVSAPVPTPADGVPEQ